MASTVKFADVIHLNTDRVSDPASAGIDRFVGLEHIEPENLHIRSWGLVADGTTFTSTFKRGQVLFGKRRAYQRKVAVADFDGVCSSDIYVFESKDPNVLLPELVPFICQSEGFYDFAVKTSAGSLSPRTNWSHLANYEFPLPPVDEQRRIADLLWAADDAIEAKRETVEKLNSVKVSAIYEKMRLNSNSQNNLPQKWQNQKLGEYLPDGSMRNGLYKPNSAYGEGTKIIRIDSFQNGQPIEKDLLKRVKVSESEIKTYAVNENDILVNRVNSLSHLGKTTIVPEMDEVTIFESNMMCLRLLAENGLLPRYAWYLISSDCGRTQLLQRAKKAIAQSSVNQDDIRSLTFPIPPIAEQENILEVVFEIENAIELATDNLNKTALLKHELLENYFR